MRRKIRSARHLRQMTTETNQEYLDAISSPFAVPTVAIWLAQGAVQYVGGLALARILGHPNLADIEAMIKQAVEEIKAFVKAELAKQITEMELRRLRGSLDSAITSLRDYDAVADKDKPKRRDLLQKAIEKSQDVMELAKLLEMNAAFVYVDAASVKSLAASVLAKLDRTTYPETKTALQTATQTLLPILEKHKASWLPENRIVYVGVMKQDRHYAQVVFKKDGVIIRGKIQHVGDRSLPTIEKLLERHREEFRKELIAQARKEYENVMDSTTVPLMNVVAEWRKLTG